VGYTDGSFAADLGHSSHDDRGAARKSSETSDDVSPVAGHQVDGFRGGRALACRQVVASV